MSKSAFVNLDIEWGELSLPLSVPVTLTVQELKERLFEISGIPPSRQKLVNFPYPDHVILASTKTKKPIKLEEGEEEQKPQEISPPIPFIEPVSETPLPTRSTPPKSPSSGTNHAQFIEALNARQVFQLDQQMQVYGSEIPKLFSGSFPQVMISSKSRNMPVLLYLFNEEDLNSIPFCLEVLSAPAIVNIINELFIFWVIKLDGELNTLVSNVFKTRDQPLFFILKETPNQGIIVVDFMQGLKSANQFLEELMILHQKSQNEGVVTEKQLLLQEQESEFQRSLEEDKRRERIRKEQEREQQRQQQMRQLTLEERQKVRQEKAKRVPPEAQLNAPDASNIVIRLFDGSRIQRRFRKKDTLQNIYDFCDSRWPENQEEKRYVLVSNFPRKVFSDKSTTVEQAQLFPQASLFMEESN